MQVLVLIMPNVNWNAVFGTRVRSLTTEIGSNSSSSSSLPAGLAVRFRIARRQLTRSNVMLSETSAALSAPHQTRGVLSG